MHGCFWHRHPGCRKAGVPKSRTEFWSSKFARNVDRDAANVQALTKAGWKVAVIWECQAFEKDTILSKVRCLIEKADHL